MVTRLTLPAIVSPGPWLLRHKGRGRPAATRLIFGARRIAQSPLPPECDLRAAVATRCLAPGCTVLMPCWPSVDAGMIGSGFGHSFQRKQGLPQTSLERTTMNVRCRNLRRIKWPKKQKTALKGAVFFSSDEDQTYLILPSLYSTCLRATGSYLRTTIFSVIVRAFFLVT